MFVVTRKNSNNLAQALSKNQKIVTSFSPPAKSQNFDSFKVVREHL